jgi:hypothetical protein
MTSVLPILDGGGMRRLFPHIPAAVPMRKLPERSSRENGSQPQALAHGNSHPPAFTGNASTEKKSVVVRLCSRHGRGVAHPPSRKPHRHGGCDNSFKPMKHFEPKFPDSYLEAETSFTDRRTGDQPYRCRYPSRSRRRHAEPCSRPSVWRQLNLGHPLIWNVVALGR